MSKYPYFRFTSYQDSAISLQHWFRHFEERGIPCALVRHESNPHFKGPGYTLWRVGVEHLADNANPNSEEFHGEMLMEANGFGKLVGR